MVLPGTEVILSRTPERAAELCEWLQVIVETYEDKLAYDQISQGKIALLGKHSPIMN
jgi:hypothetical protein